VKVSNNLRSALRYEGYAKVATQVLRDQNEYADGIDTVAGAMKSISVKFAANRENERIIADGLNSLVRVRGM
jgi:hypothetical protein